MAHLADPKDQQNLIHYNNINKNNSKCLALKYTIQTFNDPELQVFWKHCGKRRKCWSQGLSPFSIIFSTLSMTNSIIPTIFNPLLFTCLQYKTIENNVGKEEIAISPLSTVFSTHLENFLPFSSNSKLSYADTFSLDESEICLLTLWNKPSYLRVCSMSFLKTLWEKEKLLFMSNFSFCHKVFYPFG